MNVSDDSINIAIDKFTTVKKDKIIPKDIKSNLKNITLIELCKGLHVLESEKDKIQEIIKNQDEIILKGLASQKDLDIDWVNSYFGKYTLDGLDNILDLRLKELELRDIKTLKGIFI